MRKAIGLSLSVLLMLSVVIFCPISTSAVDIIPEGYTGIYSAADLNAVRNDLDGNYILMNDIDLSSVDNWLPIGGEYQEDGFSGVLDGNGHAILNMNMDADSVELDYVGLFSILNGATIKDIKAITGRIYSEDTAFLSAGAIAGMAYSSNISGCANYVEISYRWGEPADEVYTTAFDVCFDGGGIAGCIYEDTVITECCNYGRITGISRSAPIAIGGIVGVAGFPNAEITDCFNGVSLSLNTGFSSSEIGGIVGNSFDITIRRCYNAAPLHCKAGELDYIGGIVGDVNNSPSNSIVDCYYDAMATVAVGCVPILKDRDAEIYINISAESLNTESMQVQSSFVGFDFASIWRAGSKAYPYPVLRSIGDFVPEYKNGASGGIINPPEEDSVLSAVDLIGMDIDAAITLLRNNGHEITEFEDAVSIGKEQGVMLYYNEGSYGNYARGTIYQIITYGDFLITDALRSNMTLLEVQNIADQLGYTASLTEQEEYGMVYQLTVTGETWQAEYIWSEAYYDWDLGMNVLKENYDPNKAAADQVYVTKRSDTGTTDNPEDDTNPKEEQTCALVELTDVDYLAFAMLAYQSPAGVDPTVKEILGARWTAEWSNDITYGELCDHIQNWRCISGMSGTGVGFKALAFGNNQNEIIITFQGSMSPDKWKEDPDGFWADWWDNNAEMLMNGEGAQVRYAMRFYDMIVRDYAPKQIGVAGHSLGGALGDIVAAYSGCGGVTFNAAPFLDIAYAYFPDRMAASFEGVDKWQFVDSINSNDIVGMFGNSIKPRIIYTDEGLNDSAHSLQSFVYKNQVGEVCFVNGTTYAVDRITWAMPEWSLTDLKGFLTAGRYIDFGTSASDRFFGLAGADSLYDIIYESLSGVYVRHAFGGEGADEIITGLWADTIVGGKGQDFLSGSYGDDTYIYTKGDGTDYIIDFSGSDKLCLNGFAVSDQIDIKHDDGTYIIIFCNGEPIVYIDRECRSHHNKFIVAVDRGDEVTEHNISSFFNPKSIRAHLIIECPVDVQIVDSEGNVVYTLKDGEVGAHYTDYGVFYVYEEANGSYGKVVDLFEGYEVRIIGNTEGTMGIAMWNVVDGKLSESYYHIADVMVTDTMIASLENKEDEAITLEIDRDGNGVIDDSCKLVLLSEESSNPSDSSTQPTDDDYHGEDLSDKDAEDNHHSILWMTIAIICITIIAGICAIRIIRKRGNR